MLPHPQVFFLPFDLKIYFSPRPRDIGILTCECASCHSGVQFFDVASTKSASSLTFFFGTFSLQNVLFATAACNF